EYLSKHFSIGSQGFQFAWQSGTPSRSKGFEVSEHLPKRPQPQYMKFLNEKRKTLKAENPNWSRSERRDYLIEEWKTLPKEQKEIYVKSYLQDLKEYRERQKSYEADLSDDEKVIIKRVCKENHARI
ncbi:hypothetical protein QYM36_000112, partial [Artemia franciscana]